METWKLLKLGDTQINSESDRVSVEKRLVKMIEVSHT